MSVDMDKVSVMATYCDPLRVCVCVWCGVCVCVCVCACVCVGIRLSLCAVFGYSLFFTAFSMLLTYFCDVIKK